MSSLNRFARWLIGCVFTLVFGSVSANDASLIQQGAYLARAADCIACHTSAANEPYAGNYPLSTPFGLLFSANITPAKTAGIGEWTEQDFAKAVRQGVGKDGRRLYPAMPYASYAQITDDDIHALYAYFMSAEVKPVNKISKPSQLSFPFNMRILMSTWNLFFLTDTPFTEKPAESMVISRGRYLVDTLGHCGVCHTPRNFLMAEKKSTEYLGGSDIAGWYAPNITSDKGSGIGGWSVAELVTYFKIGAVVGKAQAVGGMAEVIENSLQYLTDKDLTAIALYLKQTPAISDSKQIQPRFSYGGAITTDHPIKSPQTRTFFDDVAKSEQVNAKITSNITEVSTVSGIELYNNTCASCHQADGAGLPDQYYPSLLHNSTVGNIYPNNLVMVILNGVRKKIDKTTTMMPGFAEEMSDTQIAAVANYVLQHYGNKEAQVTPQLVNDLRLGRTNNSAIPLLILFWGGVIVVLLIILMLIWRVTKNR